MSRYKEIDIIMPTRKMKHQKISSLRCQKYAQIYSSHDKNKFKAVGIKIQFSAFEKHNKTEFTTVVR